jgi:hypothetical protein
MTGLDMTGLELPTNDTPGFRRLPYGEYWDGDARELWRRHHRLRRRTGRESTALRVMSINVCPSPQGRPLAHLVRAEALHGS